MNIKSLSDDALIGLYQAGNYLAFEVLYKRYKEKVYNYLYLSTKNEEIALDLFQEIFYKVVDKLQKGLYEESGKFSHWLMRITHNALMDFYRSRYVQTTTATTITDNNEDEENIFTFIPDSSPASDEMLIKKENIHALRNLILLLPPEQQEIIHLRVYEEKSFKKIAEQLNISINTALGRMHYAIKNLRKLAKKYNVLTT